MWRGWYVSSRGRLRRISRGRSSSSMAAWWSDPSTREDSRADSTETKVKEIIINELGVEPEKVTMEASFVEDLGADSLDTVELVMAFEEEFGIEIPDEDAENLQTVGDAVKYLKEKGID